MFTKFRKPILAGLIAVLGAGFLVLVVVVFTPSSAPAAPPITWVPSSLMVEVARGESKTVSVSFISSQSANNVVVRVVPELQSFVQVSPSEFASIVKGQTLNLNVTFSASEESPFRTFDGTIQLRTKGVLARPLPVQIAIVPFSPEEVLGELPRRLLNGDVAEARKLFFAEEGKLTVIDNLTPSQLADLADCYSNAVFVEEFGHFRVYKSFLKAKPGEVTFMLERDDQGRWRVSF